MAGLLGPFANSPPAPVPALRSPPRALPPARTRPSPLSPHTTRQEIPPSPPPPAPPSRAYAPLPSSPPPPARAPPAARPENSLRQRQLASHVLPVTLVSRLPIQGFVASFGSLCSSTTCANRTTLTRSKCSLSRNTSFVNSSS